MARRDDIAEKVMLLLIEKSHQPVQKDWNVDEVAKKAYAMALAMECEREKIALEWNRQVRNHFPKKHPKRQELEKNA